VSRKQTAVAGQQQQQPEVVELRRKRDEVQIRDWNLTSRELWCALVLLCVDLLSLTLQLQLQAASDVPIQLQGDRHATRLQHLRLKSTHLKSVYTRHSF
jgi:hypothetical protein